jgi:hypothetical protein
VDLKWENAKLKNCIIESSKANKCVLQLNGSSVEKIISDGGIIDFIQQGSQLSFTTFTNKQYQIIIK